MKRTEGTISAWEMNKEMMRDEENFCFEWPAKAYEANASQLNKRSQ
jgi:hypothetical protein